MRFQMCYNNIHKALGDIFMSHISLEVNHKHFRDLYLCFCGIHDCEPSHSFGPAIRPNYLLHFVIKGKGNYYLNDNCYEVKENECFLIRPNELTFYQADKDDPWTYVWVGFDGEMAQKYLEAAGFCDDRLVRQYEHCEELKDYVTQMLSYNSLTQANELKYQGLLYLFLAKLAESSDIKVTTEHKNENHYISKAIEFIQNNYSNYIKVSDISNYLCLNRTYLTSLFQKYLGMSPQQFLIQFRITKAAQLLVETDLSVADISRSCGYNDPLAFSKSFKKIKSLSPTDFRIQMKKCS